MNSTNAIMTVATSCSLLFSASALSGNCNDPAPLADHNNAENGYYDLVDREIAASDKARLEVLAGALHGRWTGVELVKECEGHFKTPVETRQHYEVKAEITRHDTGAIRIDAEKARQSDNVATLETLYLSPEIDKEYGRPTGWHTLDFIDDNTVIFSEKSRVRNGNNFARLVHTVKRIALKDNQLTVDRILYVNGHFVEQNGWILAR